MRIVQLTPGAGTLYCGSCLRDNALVACLRRMGHDALLVPLYLPLKTDEADQSSGAPIFFGGINVYLQQKSPLFRAAPQALDRWLDAPSLLRLVAGFAARTSPDELGELTVSMLKGEEGRQVKEVDRLVAWLKSSAPPDAVSLSNALLTGLARRLHDELKCPILCTLAGEDTFLDGLPEPHRGNAWEVLRRRAASVERFVAPSRYYAEWMSRRLGLEPGRVTVLPNGIHLEGYAVSEPAQPPVIGYFARMCREKGLGTLVDAFCLLKTRARVKGLRLRVGGNVTATDEPYVQELQSKLRVHGLEACVSFEPNLDLTRKQAFFSGLSVFSVPALYGEAFGLYLLEALASGVPVVQPRHAAFPELVEATGGGLLYEPSGPEALAGRLEELLLDPARARRLGLAGRAAVLERYGIERLAQDFLALCKETARAGV